MTSLAARLRGHAPARHPQDEPRPVKPTAAAILSTSAPGSTPALADVFNPSTNRIGLLVAAVFGLTPDLIIGKLRQQTDAIKSDLSKSEAAIPVPASQ